MTLWSFPWSWEPVILSEEIDSEKSSQPIPSLLCQPQQGGEPVLQTWCEMTIICFECDLKIISAPLLSWNMCHKKVCLKC